ncbi:hypothetical protein F5Y18DRAFT_427520 [Xylariaceae sp. FL1019]|nr:hypothetical protein F5Y18DRAFT_427520 [Xylariaceae sp. FL1019]
MSDLNSFFTSNSCDSTNNDEVDMPIDVRPDGLVADQEGPGMQFRNRCFPRFLQLPAELRVLIYRFIISEHRIQNITIDWSNLRWTILVVNTTEHQVPARRLWQTSPEARAETERLCIMLPTCHVNAVGLNIIDINEGAIRRRPGRTTHIGAVPYHRDTTFVMDDQTASHLFLDRTTSMQMVTGTLYWLRSVMLYWSTFLHISSLSNTPNVSSSAHPGVLFARLPNLRRVSVGFVRRFQDIATLEGRYDDVARELEVVRDQSGDASNPLEVRINGIVQDLEPGLKAMISTTVEATVTQVEVMRQAGIEVTWVMIEAGIVRYPDIIDWPYPGN